MADIPSPITQNPFSGSVVLAIGVDPVKTIAARVNEEARASRSANSPTSKQVNNTQTPNADNFQKSSVSEDYNILKDYIWNLSENKTIIIDHVPKLIATEYNIETSPLIQNLKSSLTIGVEGVNQSASILRSASNTVVPGMLDSFKSISAPEWAKTYAENASNSDVMKNAKDYFSNIKQKLSEATKESMPSEMQWNSLKLKELYDHLYTLSRTGKKFIFPYLDDEFLSLSNRFDEGNEYLQFDAGLFQIDTSNAKSNLKKFSQLPSLLSPGAYIQMPQFYNFDSVGEPSVTISFPLYNTKNSYETQKNLKFVKLFGLNNMPYRKDLIAVDPTRIYDIVIPGKVNLPFCYVSDYTVNHLGTKSLYGEEIYPEAYSVKITFTSLIKFDANMYIDAMNMARVYVPPPGRSLAKSEIKEKKESSAKAKIIELPRGDYISEMAQRKLEESRSTPSFSKSGRVPLYRPDIDDVAR